MKFLYATTMFVLVTILTTCESPSQVTPPPKLPCDEVLDKLEECIGARPALYGGCTLSSAEHLLEMSCSELIDTLGLPRNN